MANNNQHRAWISRICARASSIVVGLAAVAFVATPSAKSQTFTMLYSFTGTNGDGSQPSAAPILDAAGNLYGNALLAGPSNKGMLYKWVKATGQEKVVHGFAGPPTDGQLPQGVLVRDKSRNLFGATSFGGESGDGTVFRISKSSQESLLYSFKGPPDTNSPNAGLVEDAAGILYGTSYGGGVSTFGTVFSVNSKTGREKVLHSFSGSSDGAQPVTALLLDPKGNLYGTSFGGHNGGGVVFKLTRKPTGGWKFKVVYSLGQSSEGRDPNSALIRDSAGNLYGTTSGGGTHGKGTVYMVNPVTGSLSVLYSFGENSGDGTSPFGDVVRDAAGTIYGTTAAGGSSGFGTVFKVTSTGTATFLHSFSGTDGRAPNGVAMDAAGNLFGVTTVGGEFGLGTIFELTP